MAPGYFVRCTTCGKLMLWGQECAKCTDPTDRDNRHNK